MMKQDVVPFQEDELYHRSVGVLSTSFCHVILFVGIPLILRIQQAFIVEEELRVVVFVFDGIVAVCQRHRVYIAGN